MKLRLVVCCLALLGTVISPPATAETVRREEFIVFLSDRDGTRQLYTVNPDGSGLTGPLNRVTSGIPWSPVVSPDGSRVTFASRRTTACPIFMTGCIREAHIWVMNVDGSELVRVTDSVGTWNTTPTWAPDGKTIVFARKMAGTPEWPDLYAATESSDGTWLETEFLSRPGWENAPDFSPDGRKLVYEYVVDDDRFYNRGEDDYAIENSDLVIARSDGSRGKRLKLSASQEGQAAWSPDGRLIAFSRWRIQPDWSPIGIWTVRRDGTGVHRLIAGDKAHDPAWSADGSEIFFDSCYHVTEEGHTCAIGRFVISTGRRSVLEDAPDVFDGMPDVGVRVVGDEG